MTSEIRIRAFRAPEDPETCLKFIEGHRKVLSIYGIENITTNNNDWMHSNSIFVIVVETLDKSKLYGGARVECFDGNNQLPIQEATGKMDPKIHEVVKYYARYGAAEISGLWNSKEVAGLGIGSIYPSRVAVALATQIGVKVMFSLCSPATVRFQKWLGGVELVDVGNKGTFYYPKLDLIATALFCDDMFELTNAVKRERDKALSIRNNPQAVVTEKSPFGNVDVIIHYDVTIASANPTEFKLSIPTSYKPSMLV